MARFKSPRQAQRFLAAHDQINTIFKPRRYCLTATSAMPGQTHSICGRTMLSR
ncbi:transposase-like protein [Roseovarius sp. MBR-78]